MHDKHGQGEGMDACMKVWVCVCVWANRWLGDYMDEWMDSPVDTRIGRWVSENVTGKEIGMGM